MTDIEQQIQDHIQKSAKELNELVRAAAIQAVAEALGASGAKPPTRARRASAKVATPRRKPAKKKALRVRRSADQIARAQESLTDYVKANPGELMENIAEALGSTSRGLHRPMSKLIAAGIVRRAGEKRASRYFLAAASASKKAASKKRSPAKKKSAKRGARKRSTKARRKAA